ncbi:MAG TPA: AAA family ATPase [Treponema sp.]|nr:AAA family ATPase [Treponema sp.]
MDAELNEFQLQAVKSIEGAVLIIAGAGSGKTRVITYRIAHMLEKGIPQHAILALTFTNKAAREMQVRVKELTGKKLQSLTVSTFHAFGLSVLRDHIENAAVSQGENLAAEQSVFSGYRKNFSIYDETDRVELIKESLRECRMASHKVDLYALGQLFSNIKTGRASWDGADIDGVSRNGEFEPVYNAYQEGLRVYNAVDFDDLLTLPLELLKENPDILKQYRSRFRYIMVDEFQDTSFLQYRLMRVLALGEDVPFPPEKKIRKKKAPDNANDAVTLPPGGIDAANVCVVGDDDQSIYSWRGANYENLLLFEKDFPGALEIKLEQNYRSTSTILEAANGVISHNANRKEKSLWSGNSGGKPVELFYPENESAEADFIASQIRHLRIMESFKNRDFGVLTRTNSLTRNIEEAFLAADIPYKISGGTSFFQRKEIKDIISYLKVIANPDDDVSLLRIINTPRRGIGKTSITALSALARKNHSSLWDAVCRHCRSADAGQQHLFQDSKDSGDLDTFMNLIEFFRSEIIGRKSNPGQPWSLAGKVRALIDNIDYWSFLIVEHGKDEKKARWKFSNLEYFIRMIENWEKDPDNHDSGLYAWINRISLITRDDGEEDSDDKANIMTIHASKGLEFPVVFIAGAEKGIIPHERSLTENGDEAGTLEEERRLFYVAITRARKKLYITSCRNRRRLQSAVECAPSPFLEEIPPHLIEVHEPEPETEVDAETASKFMERLRARFKVE